MISILTGEMNRPQLQDILGISNRSHFVAAYLGPALKAGLIEITLLHNIGKIEGGAPISSNDSLVADAGE